MKKRIVLGLVCLISAVIFMVRSFLVPKTRVVIKPSSMASLEELAFYSYRQLAVRLPDQTVYLFVVEDKNGFDSYIQSFVGYGIKQEKQDFTVLNFKDIDTYQKRLRTFFKEINSDFDLNLNQNLLIKISRENYFQYQKELLSLAKGPQVFYFYDYQDLTKKNCESWKKAFLLSKPEDLNCFANRHIRKMQKKQTDLYFLEQVKPKHFIVFRFLR